MWQVCWKLERSIYRHYLRRSCFQGRDASPSLYRSQCKPIVSWQTPLCLVTLMMVEAWSPVSPVPVKFHERIFSVRSERQSINQNNCAFKRSKNWLDIHWDCINCKVQIVLSVLSTLQFGFDWIEPLLHIYLLWWPTAPHRIDWVCWRICLMIRALEWTGGVSILMIPQEGNCWHSAPFQRHLNISRGSVYLRRESCLMLFNHNAKALDPSVYILLPANWSSCRVRLIPKLELKLKVSQLSSSEDSTCWSEPLLGRKLNRNC